MDVMNLLNIGSGEIYPAFFKAYRDRKNISVFSAQFSEKTLIFAALKGRKVYVCADYAQGKEAFSQIQCLDENAVFLPPKDDVLTYKKLMSAEAETQRLGALYKIISSESSTIVTCVAALAQLYPDREQFSSAVTVLEKGADYDLGALKKRLISLGYTPEEKADRAGTMGSRGDILDVWAAGEDDPYRIEFFGDTIDSVRRIDGETFLSKKSLNKAVIPPATEVFYTAAEAEAVLKTLKKQAGEERQLQTAADLALRLAGGSCLALSFLLPLFKHSGFFDFVRPDSIVFEECKQISDTLDMVYKDHENRFKTLLAAGETFAFGFDAFLNRDKVFDSLGAVMIAFHRVTTQNRIFSPQALFTFNAQPLPDYAHDYNQLAADLKNWSGNYRVKIFCGNEDAVSSMTSFLNENAVGIGFNSGLELSPCSLDRGGILHDLKLALIGTRDLSARRSVKSVKRKKNDVFTLPEVGDYVVHNVHGIGLCESVEKLNLTGALRDYLVIRYEGGDKLYLPVENMDSLSKYVAGGESPRLSKIGGADFDKVKQKVKSGIKTMALDLMKLYAERSLQKGYRYSPSDEMTDEFASDFPYTETPDQLTAIAEGLNDLKTGKVMDRLLCGDVGYGKTEVAMRLAFKVIAEGKQVAFISPTTILARQHAETVVRRMEKYGVRFARLTRFDSRAEQAEAIEKLQSGKADIVCGTHRILSKDVKFKDLGLMILDEEQRFGVADKEKLKVLKKNVNVLSMSATPIPRTLYMTMLNIRDISVLDTPPSDRLPVQTFVTEYSDTLVADAVKRELGRGGQVFVVYNKVASIDSFAARLKGFLPDVRFTVAHGQMEEKALEKAVEQFLSGGSDVLVSSTIIENGIDMPRANTMIVTDADKLGLSQLYQLRGRVGRSNRLAYVYFTFDSEKVMSETAYKRLEAITKFTELGSGFKIAMADLEIRGAGNVLGREQHGHMEKVGYDMYCKLLSSAVKELSGQGSKNLNEVKMQIDFPAFIPADYVESQEQRLSLYGNIASIDSIERRETLKKELADVYGKLPQPAVNLIEVALIKNLSAAIGAKSVLIAGSAAAVIFAKAMDIPEKAVALSARKSSVKLDFNGSPALRWAGKTSQKELLDFLLKL